MKMAGADAESKKTYLEIKTIDREDGGKVLQFQLDSSVPLKPLANDLTKIKPSEYKSILHKSMHPDVEMAFSRGWNVRADLTDGIPPAQIVINIPMTEDVEAEGFIRSFMTDVMNERKIKEKAVEMFGGTEAAVFCSQIMFHTT